MSTNLTGCYYGDPQASAYVAHTHVVNFNTTGIGSGVQVGIVHATADKPVHIEASSLVVTAFNAVTTNVLSVGTSSAATELLPAQAITPGTAGLYPSNSFKQYTTLGHNGAGAITVTGAQIGDVVTGVTGITSGTLGDLSAGFESVISVAGQLQQSSATDYSAKALLITLTRNASGTRYLRVTTDTPIWVKYTQTGTAATAGQAIVIIREFQENETPIA